MHVTHHLVPDRRPARRRTALRRLAVPLSALLAVAGGWPMASAAPAAQPSANQRPSPHTADDGALSQGPPAASAAAAGQQRRVEVPGARTENTTTWANPDGTVSVETHAGPVRFRKGGKWVDIDPTLRRAADGSVRAVAHPHGLRIAGRTGEGGGDLLTLGGGGRTVTLGWKGPLPEPVLSGHRATYANVLPATDLVVEATRTGFEQYLVVKDRSAADEVESFTLPLRTEGLTTTRNSDGSLSFTDPSTKKAVGRLPAPVMWEAGRQKRGGQDGRRTAVGMTLEREGGRLGLRLTPDRDFLASPDTRYPVTIDPAVFLSPHVDTTVVRGSQEDFSGAVGLRVGRESGKEAARSFVQFPRTPGMTGGAVLDAQLSLFPLSSAQCAPRSWEVWDTGAVSSATRWGTQPAWRTKAATSTLTSGASADCPAREVTLDVTSLVSQWAAVDRATDTLGLRATDENDTSAFKVFASGDNVSNVPALLVTYRPTSDPATDHVQYWNDVLLSAYRTAGGAPGPLARAGAMMHGAVYDAANSIRCSEGETRCLGRPYLVKTTAPADADINSAIDQAAYLVLEAVFPNMDFARQLAAAGESIPQTVTGTQRRAGSSVGHQAARAMVDARAADGSQTSTPYPGSSSPGNWRPTDANPAATPAWGLVKPFGLTSGSQFRQRRLTDYGSMEALLRSSDYSNQVNEVRDLGGVESPLRTADQTQAAFFWANDVDGTYKPPGQLFELTQTVSRQHRLTVDANAKLFALVAFAMADAGIAAWDAKYQTNIDLWRPESAIRLDGDGNPLTSADPEWQPLSRNREGQHFSPPFPAHVSGHATFGAAWARTMERWFGTDDIGFTAGTEDFDALGVTRTFTSFSDAAQENARSRIWLGVHYSWDGTDGITVGNSVADHISSNSVGPNSSDLWKEYELLHNLSGCQATGRQLVAEHRWSAYECRRASTTNDDHRLYVK
ncbi:DNRLRE domain-containing protein [Streptomyces sp. TRM76323]|uniref:DNRLRE domain-containing protein n=1 Tax=Streptomyces tamarix TaxID=3078565 RepID=A0ABU3QEV1_9ACTN|nr:DNRLRE domain-containing protein [Streptomyces tamarix]MDT9681043.1 DNRLRE domain-containing protein [Streptomyces tamarix]